MYDFEKLGMFYLGKIISPKTRKLEKNLLLYESKDLTTHAVCVGMTGSGKTGLGIALLEEAAIDKIPAIVIDPKGDLGDLLLTFPKLTAKDFKPWVDSASAEKKGMNLNEYASYVAQNWKKGLSDWGQDGKRIQKFKDSVEVALYTPASNAGVPISILNSFAAPNQEQRRDTTAVLDKTLSITSSLLGLLGIDANPLKSREFILISSIIQEAWQNGQDLDIPLLIQQIQKPPFSKMGTLDIDTFYPAKERMTLSITLNNLLASPGFQAWMQGPPLDIQGLLYTETGKPKVSIISIAHLNDSERMFFVTLLLNEILTWTRQQSGTSSLRAILYMDEIFGFFPPVAMPPSKLPMLSLLKQARAFGLGIVLATQNPVDLDYKGLANCGTWFIGKLQTARDKKRVLEGLSIASNGEIDAKALNKLVAMTGKRTFIMRSIHEKDPILFQTRWTLSYLYGPLTISQITNLTDHSKEAVQVKKLSELASKEMKKEGARPTIPTNIEEFFIHLDDSNKPVHYEPKILGIAKLHFVNSKNDLDIWEEVSYIQKPSFDGKNVNWDEGKNIIDLNDYLEKEPIAGSSFEELTASLLQEKNYATFAKRFADSLYQNRTHIIYQTTNPKMISKPNESEKDFRIRVSHHFREKRDDLVTKMRKKYEAKIETLTDKIRRAQDKFTQKKQQMGMQKVDTMISVGSTILGAIFGRKATRGTLSQTGTTLRRASRIGRDAEEAKQAQKEVTLYQAQLQEIENAMQKEISELMMNGDPAHIAIHEINIRPRKSDISIEKIALVWCPKIKD